MSETNPIADKCLLTARVFREDVHKYLCVSCDVNARLRNPINQREPTDLSVKHYLARGLRVRYRCEECLKVITKEKPVEECSVCYAKHTKLITKLDAEGAQTGSTRFMYNVHSDKFVYLYI